VDFGSLWFPSSVERVPGDGFKRSASLETVTFETGSQL
jgi:hypothetical protein